MLFASRISESLCYACVQLHARVFGYIVAKRIKDVHMSDFDIIIFYMCILFHEQILRQHIEYHSG